jgi:glycosyltransferase involved in cell wall biosynthesis
MKIAFFHNLPLGGAKKVVYEQIKYLSKRNEIDLYQLIPSDTFFPTEKFATHVYNYTFQMNSKLPDVLSRLNKDYKNFILLANLHKKIAKEIDSKKYDIVIVHPDKYTQAPFILKYLKSTSVYYAHEWLRIVYEKEYAFQEDVTILKKLYEEFTRQIRKSIDRDNLLASDIILANSKFTSQNIKKAYERNASINWPGVDIRIFRPLRIKKEYDILFVGDKSSHEGFDMLSNIEKISKITISVKTISKKSESFGVSEEKLAEMYNKARLVICLARNEPFGLVPLEAMACGVPVIAVNEGGYRETIIDGKTGYLLPRDPKVLAEKLDYLLSSEKVRVRMGENARKHVVANWTWEKSVKKLEKFL